MSTLSVENLQHPSSSNANITLDSNGNINLGAGSASLPSITAQGDTNTGIYFPAADNIGFATGGTIRGRWTDNGLCFGTDTAAANALDDYEEGTWTPAWAFAASGSATIQFDSATYTKVGNLVTFCLRCNTSATSSPSGNATITGLPFTVSALNSSDAAFVIGAALRFASDMPNFRVFGSGTSLIFRKQATNSSGSTSLQGSDLNSGAGQNIVSVSGFYYI